MPNRSTLSAAALVVSVVAVACSAPPPSSPEERVDRTSAASTVGGCTCVGSGSCAAETFSNIPSDGTYYVTTFGGGADTQPMACGGTADATWAYVADEARFGCGTKVQINANGKSCVAQVADCGPNRCVEQAAANSGCSTNFPILDMSPFITQYLLGTTSAGWSDHLQVTAAVVGSGTAIGCPGGAVTPADAGSGSGSGSGGGSGSGSGSSSGGGSGSGSSSGSGSGSGSSSGSGSGGSSSGGGSSGGSSGGGSGSSSGVVAGDGGNAVAPDGGSNSAFVGQSSGCSLGESSRSETLWGVLLSAAGLALARRRRG